MYKKNIFMVSGLCAAALCLFAQTGMFTRISSARTDALTNTKAAKSAVVRPASQEAGAHAMRVHAPEADGEETVVIDNLPSLDDNMSNYVVADLNDDKYEWEYYQKKWGGTVEDAWFEISVSSYGKTADDWLFIPFELPVSGGTLNLSFQAVTSYSDGHYFSVCYGNAATPEAMSTQMVSKENFGTGGTSWTKGQTIEASSQGPEAGKYWLGIHLTSPTGGYKLWIKDITLSVKAKSIPSVGPGGEIFEMHPTEEEFASCTVIDGNGDGNKFSSWIHNDLNGDFLDWAIYYNSKDAPAASSDADEWLITPAVDFFDPEKIYSVSIDASTTSTYGSEAFEVVLAKEPTLESMRAGRVVLDEPALASKEFTTCSSRFGIPGAGMYHIGIHVKSDIDLGWRIAFKDLKVCITEQTAHVPGVCTDLSAVPDPHGALRANVGFRMPTVYVNDGVIPSDETLEADVVTPAGKKTVTGMPGEAVSATVDAVEGTNVVEVVVRNAKGVGQTARQAVCCGLDSPVDPVVVSVVSDDNMSLTLNWDPVSKGQNGGVVDPDGVKYNIYEYIYDGTISGWFPVKKGLTERTYTYRAASSTQTLCQLQVSAVNEKGESLGSLESYASAILGTPHKLPMNETFAGGQMKYAGLLLDYPDETYTAEWALDSPANVGITGGPAYALMCLVMEIGNEGKGYVELPKFSTQGCEKVSLRILTYICSATPTTTVRIHSSEGRGNGVVLGVIDTSTGEGWCELTYEIPAEYEGKSWNVVSFDVNCEHAGQVFVLAETDIYETKAFDLALVRSDMPSYVRLGDEAEFKAYVENKGYNAVQAPAMKAELCESGNVLREVEMAFSPVSLAASEKAEYTGKIAFDNADMLGKELTLRLGIDSADEEKDNNTLSSGVRVGLGELPIADNLQTALAANGRDVELSWEDPYAEGVVENVEAYPHGFYGGEMGSWRNLDFDRANTYRTENYNIPDAGLPKAFQAVNCHMSGMDGMNQPSGDQFFMVFCPEGGQADDWLISPEVKGGSKMSFQLTPLAAQYPESIEVMVSTTDGDVDSFKTIETIKTGNPGWKEYSFTLPADAKYFAIHYCSNDQFGLCIDDIVYSPVAPEIEITGWNVYKEGALLQEGIDATRYTDNTVKDSNVYHYNVAAVGKRKGVEMVFPLSATVESPRNWSVDELGADGWRVIASDGMLTVEGCEGLPIEIMDIAGIRVYGIGAAPAKVEKSLCRGVYVVRVDGKSLKVAVR